jgi:hypothetical protein
VLVRVYARPLLARQSGLPTQEKSEKRSWTAPFRWCSTLSELVRRLELPRDVMVPVILDTEVSA